jgi:hypothetical protein
VLKDKERLWSEDTLKYKKEESVSPCGEYTLCIYEHETGDSTWNVSRGVVTHNKCGQVIKTFKRNYPHFPYCWVVKNNHTYLFAAEHYEFYGVLDCANVKYSLCDKDRFCWVNIEWDDEDPEELKVEGCYWGRS